MLINVTVIGEPDTIPLRRNFKLEDELDREIFRNTLGVLRKKISSNSKLNVNECLYLFCDFVLRELCMKKTVTEIEQNAMGVISESQVFIGVPQTLTEIKIEILLNQILKESVFIRNAISKGN